MSDFPLQARRMFARFFAVLCAVGAATALAGFLWRGLDFAASALLGSLIVGLNLLWTRNVVRRALASHQPRVLVVAAYLMKLAVFVAVLYVAIVRFDMDPLGILAGVSALAITSLLIGLTRYGM